MSASRCRTILLAGALLGFAQSPSAQVPQGTAITYQGELRQNGNAVNGSTDMAFSLFGTPSGGMQIGPAVTFTAAGANAVDVKNGVFTVTLDFGPTAFNSLVTDERYLQVSVNGNPLTPRTKIENAPYALQSRTSELAYSVSNASIGSAQIVASQVQQRVTGTCPGGAIQSIAQNGTVGCHADGGTITSVQAGTGLSGGGSSGDVSLAVANPLHLDGTDVDGVVAAHNSASAGPARAIVGTSDATSGSAIKGVSASASGTTYALAGVAQSPDAIAIIGQNLATTGYATGVIGVSPSPSGNAVVGWATAQSGPAWGVVGSSDSPDGIGVYGIDYSATGAAEGVRGASYSAAGIGVHGSAELDSGYSVGVKGTSASPDGTGVSGSGGFAGVYGSSGTANGSGVEGNAYGDGGDGVAGYAVSETGTGAGVHGVSYSTQGGIGVEGTATASTGNNSGVFGSAYSSTGVGVYGAGNNGSTGMVAWSGSTGYGLSAYSFGNNAIYAQSASSNANTAAIRGYNTTGYALVGEGANIGVYAHNLSGTPGRDVYLATAGLAGDFYGGVWIHGSLTKSSGTFKIDHPLDPANKYLSHSFVESPDMKNVYDGVVRLDASGQAWVELPSYFDALNRDFRYQLTALDRPAPSLYVADRIAGNRFRIAGGSAGQEVSWQVTGTRRDAWAEAHRVVVEEEKSAAERGRYISPELFGHGPDAALAPDPSADPAAPPAAPRPAVAEQRRRVDAAAMTPAPRKSPRRVDAKP